MKAAAATTSNPIRGGLITQRPSWADYLILLSRLQRRGLLGRTVIYPAIGVDVLPAFVTKVIGVNIRPFSIEEIREQLSPRLGFRFNEGIRHRLSANLTYLDNVDVRNTQRLQEVLDAQHPASPKSLLIKGLFQRAFLEEWDPDNERFQPVAVGEAEEGARHWIGKMIDYLNVGDTIIVFDRVFFPFLTSHSHLQEVNLDAVDPDYDLAGPYDEVLFLRDYCRVFRKVREASLDD